MGTRSLTPGHEIIRFGPKVITDRNKFINSMPQNYKALQQDNNTLGGDQNDLSLTYLKQGHDLCVFSQLSPEGLHGNSYLMT